VKETVPDVVCAQLNATGLDGNDLVDGPDLRSFVVDLDPPLRSWPILVFKALRMGHHLHGSLNAWIEVLLLILFQTDGWKAAKQSLERRIHFVQEVLPRIAQFKTVNAHLLFSENLHLLWHLPKNVRVVCSFWGSDLLRRSSILNDFFVRNALHRSDAITIQTDELAEMMYVKYGRQLKDKTRIVRFPNTTEVRDAIDDHRSNRKATSAFLDARGLDPTAPTVVVGHNGNPMNNQLPILQSILPMLDAHPQPVNVIIPFTYGGSADDLDGLKQTIGDRSDVFVQTEFLSIQDLALLRVVTDVYIHMPVTDALSGALTEALYAGAVSITGAWLPYGIYRREVGIDLVECASFAELPAMLDHALKNLGSDHSDHRVALNRVFWTEETGQHWAHLLAPRSFA
jgi:hypothetical protein